jgi:predicted NBD/HSP70 family sugar kinase
MKLIIRGRQGGKTTELIRLAAETGTYIVCTDQRRARQIAQQAQDMGLSIPFPMAAREWQERAYYPPGVRSVAFDDLDRIIQNMTGVPALAATWTADES